MRVVRSERLTVNAVLRYVRVPQAVLVDAVRGQKLWEVFLLVLMH